MTYFKFNGAINSNAEESFVVSQCGAGKTVKNRVVVGNSKRQYVVRLNSAGHKYIKMDGKDVLLRSLKGKYKYA